MLWLCVSGYGYADRLCGYVLQGVVVLMGCAIAPLLSSVADALEAIILTMHNEDFSL